MTVFDRADERETGHEQVVFAQDPASGLRAIIAVHSTTLGPALGGTRFYPYGSEEQALTDALRLSSSMTLKAACAGLDQGGGKAVLIGDPALVKTPALLQSYGRAVQALAGRYVTACDVGTFPEDMDVVGTETTFVTSRTVANGGSGDSAPLTAYGVLQAMRAAAAHRWGSPSLEGRRVGVEGVGKVGRSLVGMLVEAGAQVSMSDVHAPALEAVRAAHPQVRVVEDVPGEQLDVFAPCALGGRVDDALVARLQAEVVCGAANNQLAHAGVSAALQERGICWVPDHIANAGGLIQVADEVLGYDEARATARVTAIYDSVAEVLALAESQQLTPAGAAASRARQRLAAARA